MNLCQTNVAFDWTNAPLLDMKSIFSSPLQADCPIYYAYLTMHNYMVSYIIQFAVSIVLLQPAHNPLRLTFQ